MNKLIISVLLALVAFSSQASAQQVSSKDEALVEEPETKLWRVGFFEMKKE